MSENATCFQRGHELRQSFDDDLTPYVYCARCFEQFPDSATAQVREQRLLADAYRRGEIGHCLPAHHKPTPRNVG